MTRLVRHVALLAGAGIVLSACGGGNGDNGGVTAPPAVATFQSKGGTSFAAFFDTSPGTADASVKDPTAADVPPLSLTTEPFDN